MQCRRRGVGAGYVLIWISAGLRSIGVVGVVLVQVLI